MRSTYTLLSLTLLVGCWGADSKLNEAVQLAADGKTEASLVAFKEVDTTWPESPQATTARDHIQCHASRKEGSISSWSEYQAVHPNGVCQDECATELARLQKEADEAKAAADAKAAEEAKATAEKRGNDAAGFQTMLWALAYDCEELKKKSKGALRGSGINAEKLWAVPADYLESHFDIAMTLVKAKKEPFEKLFAWKLNMGDDKLGLGPACSGALTKAIERVDQECIKSGSSASLDWITNAGAEECGLEKLE